MSEINIKNIGQVGLNSGRNVNSRENREETKTSNEVTDNTAKQTDTVSLTNTATQLTALQQQISGASEVNSEKVASLQAAIADGSYHIDIPKLAQNMIDFETNR